MTLNRKVIFETMSRIERNYHYTAIYTAFMVSILLILQVISLFKEF